MIRLAALLAACSLASSPALADLCALVKKPIADAAVAALTRGTVVQFWCEGCDHKPGEKADKTVVQNTAAVKDDYEDYWRVQINGTDYDLGYTFVGGDKPGAKWDNLGAKLNCDPDMIQDGDDTMRVLPPELVTR